MSLLTYLKAVDPCIKKKQYDTHVFFSSNLTHSIILVKEDSLKNIN